MQKKLFSTRMQVRGKCAFMAKITNSVLKQEGTLLKRIFRENEITKKQKINQRKIKLPEKTPGSP